MAFLFSSLPARTRKAPLAPSPTVLAALTAAMLAPIPAEARAQEDQPLELGPLRVEDMNAGMNALDRDTGLATLPGTVQDTPQAIVVIPQQQLREQGVTSLEQALRNVPLPHTFGRSGFSSCQGRGSQ
mgnify:CR=1 FL=1